MLFEHIEGGIDREIAYIEELINTNGEHIKVEFSDEDGMNAEEDEVNEKFKENSTNETKY